MAARRRHLALAAGVLALAQASVLATAAAGASAAESPAGPTPTTTTPAPSPQPPAAPAQPTTVTLSDDRTLATWAHPVEVVRISAHPRADSRTIAHTRLETEDGFPDVYLLLSSLTDAHGQVWVRLRIPGRPNGRIGWVLRGALGEFHVTHWRLEVSLSRRRLKAFDDGRLRFTAPAGVGKPSTPTPAGHFWIRERVKLTNPSNPYWPYAMGTSDYSTLTEWPGGGVVGIHGDFGEPQLIPGAPSHGCIRLRDPDMTWVGRHVQVGTPVDIVP